MARNNNLDFRPATVDIYARPGQDLTWRVSISDEGITAGMITCVVGGQTPVTDTSVSSTGLLVVDITLTSTQTTALGSTSVAWSLSNTVAGVTTPYLCGTYVGSDVGNSSNGLSAQVVATTGHAVVQTLVSTSAATALAAHLADTTDAHDASAVSVLDTAANYSGGTVEAVLLEQVTKFAPMRTAFKSRQVPAADKNQAYVAITFDDGHSTVYTNAYPRMKKLGMVGTLCITTDWIGDAGRMTWDQVLEMEADGWEIASHSVDHASLTAITLSQVIDELELSKAALYANGVRKVRGFVPPYGLYDAAGLAEVKKRYEWNRFNGEDATHPAIWTIDRYNVTAINPGSDILRFKATLDRAIYNGTYVGPLFHHVVPGASSGNDYNEDEFQTFIDYLAARNVAVGTVSDRLLAGLASDYDGVDLAYNGNMVHGSGTNLTYWIKSTGSPTWGLGLDPAFPSLPVARVTQGDFFDVDSPYWAPVTAGSTYLCDMTMKADSTFGVGVAGLIFITWYQSDKTTAISNSSNSSVTLSSSVYRSFPLEATAPSGAAFCRIRIRTNSSTTAAFVANVSFRKKLT